jgi:uncharacterized protein YecT (DUF1311 family)
MRYAAAVLLALAPLPAVAQDCGSLPTQTEMSQCAGDAFSAADAALNTLYREMKDRLAGDAATSDLLTKAQRAWLAYRDGECRFASSGVAGGSVYPMIWSACLEGLTRARIADFNAYLSCEEGDLSCPLPPG